jgi:hypothetical protein
MEAMLGIFQCSYPYLKLAKTLHLSYYHLCFLVNKSREESRGAGSFRNQGAKVGRGGGGTTMYTTHVSKCKNDKEKRMKNW